MKEEMPSSGREPEEKENAEAEDWLRDSASSGAERLLAQGETVEHPEVPVKDDFIVRKVVKLSPDPSVPEKIRDEFRSRRAVSLSDTTPHGPPNNRGRKKGSIRPD